MEKTKKGFTLVELVIVVAVMAVLVAVAIPTVGAITKSAKESVAETNAQTIESMIKLAEAEHSETADDPLEAEEIAIAIVEAKLGIESGKFYYNSKTGKCVVDGTEGFSAGDDDILITFTSGNPSTVTVGEGEGEGGAVTKKLNGAS